MERRHFFGRIASALMGWVGAKGALAEQPQHAVVVHFDYRQTDLDLMWQLEDDLDVVITAAGVGELDGHELATDGSGGTVFLYGPNGDALFDAVHELLKVNPVTRNATVVIRYGDPEDDVRERHVRIATKG